MKALHEFEQSVYKEKKCIHSTLNIKESSCQH